MFNQTYDFVFFLKVDHGGHVVWTDFNSKGIEDCLVLSCLCSGGNVLFGQHGLHIRKDSDPIGEQIDMNEEAEKIRSQSIF